MVTHNFTENTRKNYPFWRHCYIFLAYLLLCRILKSPTFKGLSLSGLLITSILEQEIGSILEGDIMSILEGEIISTLDPLEVPFPTTVMTI